MTKKTFLILVLAFSAFVIVGRAVQAYQLGNHFMDTDPESDENCWQAGWRFYVKGFGEFYGLPDQSYIAGPNGDSTNHTDLILHYPGGAEILTGLTYFVCGTGNVPCLRVLPLLFSSFTTGTFLIFLGEILPPLGALVLALALLATPLFTNNMASLAFHSYAFALLLWQMMILIRFGLLREGSRRSALCWLLGVGFLQGCFSLDYFFVVALLGVPFMLWLKRPGDGGTWWKFNFAATTGFLAGFAVHFAQVALYLRGVSQAFGEFVHAGKYRSAGIGNAMSWVKPENLGLLNVLRRQFDVYFSHPLNFGFPAQILISLVTLAILFLKPQRLLGKIYWRPEFRYAKAIAASFLVAALWAVVMRDHAYVHYFLVRHYFVAYFLSLYFLIFSLTAPLLKRGVDAGFTSAGE